MSNEKMNLCFLETVYIFKPMTIFQIGCSCLALFALYLIEPSHIRGIMPRLPLLSLIINSRKDGDLALSTSFVSPKEGNWQMSFTFRLLLSGCFPGCGWHGERLTMSEHTFSTSPHWCYPTWTVSKVVHRHSAAQTNKQTRMCTKRAMD